MELTCTPRSTWTTRRRRIARRLARRTGPLAIGAAAVVAAVLVPITVGMSQSVVRDPAMGSSSTAGWWGGSMTLQVPTQGAELRPGDVVSFVPPTPWVGAGGVVRRVVAVRDGQVLTRGDAAAATDPWSLNVGEVGFSRVVVRVPWVGALVDRGLAWWGSAVGVGVLVVLVCAGSPTPTRVRSRSVGQVVTRHTAGAGR